MAEYKDREAFIPYRKADVIELCVEDGKLGAADAKKFREFCEIVSSYYHFDFLKTIESLKDNFAHINPDADTKARIVPTPQQCKEREMQLLEKFEEVLQRANYKRLTQEEWEQATSQESLITLKMQVDFDDFERWVCYHRGDGKNTVQIKKLFGKKELTMDTYERVVLLIQFKDEAYFKAKKRKLETLGFQPGKMYIYMYKKIPKADMEVLFPNVKISMNLKDRLMLIVPACAAGFLTLFKILGSLLIIAAIVLYAVGITKDEIKTDMPTLIAALTGLGILGGFVFKQYVGYKNKRMKFLKDITDTLFFRCLDFNGGVFNTVIDTAEEEECKEVILAYYHLLTSKEALNEEQLDNKIEHWLEQKFNTKVDFAVAKALGKLEHLKGKVDGAEQAVVSRDAKGVCKALAIDDAKTVIDYIWDNFYSYND
jgi:hypothetical protein